MADPSRTANDAVAGRAPPEAGDPFPLPLSPFELYLLLDERPDYPMTWTIDLWFRGTLDPVATERAVHTAVARHPLLTARLDWGRQPHWVRTEETATASVPVVRMSGSDEPWPTDLAIDPTREPGMKVWYGCGEEYSVVRLLGHHACGDGQGARRWIADFMATYACETGGVLRRDPRGPLRFDRLRERGRIVPSARLRRTTFWERLRNAYGFFFLKPSPLRTTSPPATRARSGRTWSGVLEGVLPSHGVQPPLPGDAPGSFNDVAVALLFRTLADWNLARGSSTRRERLRVLVPIDLRRASDYRMPWTNRMTFGFLSRRLRDCLDWEPLIEGVRREMQYVKTAQLGLDFLEGLELAPALRRFAGPLRSLSGCMSTTVLTNLDDPTRGFARWFPLREDGCLIVGDVDLARVAGAPPIRRLTRAGFGLSQFGNRMTVALRTDSTVFDESESRELLDGYLQAWRWWSQEHSPQSSEDDRNPDGRDSDGTTVAKRMVS